MIRRDDLIALFQRMYSEHWAYEWGAARRGCVDCSGAFVYAYRQLGASIYHGSNAIARRYVGAMTDTPRPGYAAFKWRKTDTAKYPDGRGDYYHIGLVDSDGQHVLNAQGTKAGFTRTNISKWHCFAPLLAVSYQDSSDDTGGDSMTPYDAVVSTSSGSLNMRSGPGTDYPVIFKLPKNTPVTVLVEYDTGWAFVDEDGTQGYVSLKYLTRVNDPESAQDAPDAPAGDLPAEAEKTQQAQTGEESAISTTLRRSDGAEIVLLGLWTVVEKPPGEIPNF